MGTIKGNGIRKGIQEFQKLKRWMQPFRAEGGVRKTETSGEDFPRLAYGFFNVK